MAIELAVSLRLAVLVVILNRGNYFAEEFKCGLDPLLVIFDHFSDLVEEVPELLLTVKTLYCETDHVVEQPHLASGHWAVALSSLQVAQEKRAKDGVGILRVGRRN